MKANFVVLIFLTLGLYSPLSSANGLTYTKWLEANQVEKLWQKLTPKVRSLFKNDLKGLQEFIKYINTEYKSYGQITEQKEINDSRGSTWWQIKRNPNNEKEVQYKWSYGTDGQITGLYFGKRALPLPTEYLNYRTKTALQLPFNNTWEVIWGGRTVEQNYHSAYPDQRFALDIMIIKNGRSFKNDGKKLSDYHCFNRKILAPGSGTIVTVENSLKDNSIGVMDSKHPFGNHVWIDHQNGEYTMLGHMKKGSLKVKSLEKVVAGQELGLCGNSGNTSEPHIHMHMPNTALPYKGHGLPLQFKKVLVNGKIKKSHEVVRGELIQNYAAGAQK